MYYFTSRSILFHLWRRHHYWWRAATFRPVPGAEDLWAGIDLYRATPVLTQGLGFCSPIRRTAPFCRLTTHIGMCSIFSNPDPHGSQFSLLLRHTRGCGGPTLTRNLTGLDDLKLINTLSSFKMLFWKHGWILYKNKEFRAQTAKCKSF
jgi:hypothetical protein